VFLVKSLKSSGQFLYASLKNHDVFSINTDGIEYKNKRHLFKLPEKVIHPSHFKLIANNRQNYFIVQLNKKQFIMYDMFEKVRHKDVFDLDNNYTGKEWNWEQKQAYHSFLGSLKIEDSSWKKNAPVFKGKNHIRNMEKKANKSFRTPGSTK
jgi:hypothetical protein